MKNLLIAAAAASLLAGTWAVAQAPTMTSVAAGMADPAPTQALPYVAKAGASDLYEIQSSQLALTNGQDAKVKAFARMMISHHTKTTRDVTAAARKADLNPPAPMLEPMQAEMIAQLQPLSGEAFDQAYIAQQKTAHGMALTLHKTYAANGDTPALKRAAAKAVPIVRGHIAQLERM